MKERLPRHIALKCPYGECSRDSSDSTSRRIVRKGSYFRKEDSKWIPRFRCLVCGKTFSSSRLTACFGQKKRKLNSEIRDLLCSGVSQRRVARLIGVNRKTVIRKLLFLAAQARLDRLQYLETFRSKPIENLQFDEMESFEWSKCLPVSIPLLVLPKERKILSFRVGRMPAKGPLAEISRRKYGPRADDRPQIAKALFDEVKEFIAPRCVIRSDQNPKYPAWLKGHFKDVLHETVKGRRGCIVGQGELKKVGFDPLFDLNHSCAMIRANINRLFRRTWCTTKRRDRLQAHLELYVQYHNRMLT
jgi:transposase-like protein